MSKIMHNGGVKFVCSTVYLLCWYWTVNADVSCINKYAVPKYKDNLRWRVNLHIWWIECICVNDMQYHGIETFFQWNSLISFCYVCCYAYSCLLLYMLLLTHAYCYTCCYLLLFIAMHVITYSCLLLCLLLFTHAYCYACYYLLLIITMLVAIYSCLLLYMLLFAQ